MKNLRRSYAKLMKNLRWHYILWKRKIPGKWCHSWYPLSEAVIGRILWAKNNWLPEWRLPKNAFEKWLTIFLRKPYEIVSRCYLQETYENLTMNLGKKSYEKPYEVSKIGPQNVFSDVLSERILSRKADGRLFHWWLHSNIQLMQSATDVRQRRYFWTKKTPNRVDQHRSDVLSLTAANNIWWHHNRRLR